jgi:accessory gene regulator protein AgrB
MYVCLPHNFPACLPACILILIRAYGCAPTACTATQGVTAAHIIDGRSRHSILMELLTNEVRAFLRFLVLLLLAHVVCVYVCVVSPVPLLCAALCASLSQGCAHVRCVSQGVGTMITG